MPYVSQFVGPSGLGPPNDVRGGRQPLLSPTGQDWLTAITVIAAIVLAVVLFARLGRRSKDATERGVGLVVALLVGQAVAVVVSSYPLKDTAISGIATSSRWYRWPSRWCCGACAGCGC